MSVIYAKLPLSLLSSFGLAPLVGARPYDVLTPSRPRQSFISVLSFDATIQLDYIAQAYPVVSEFCQLFEECFNVCYFDIQCGISGLNDLTAVYESNILYHTADTNTQT